MATTGSTMHHSNRLRVLIRQDFNQRFAGNAVGVGWMLILPLLQLALFDLVFVEIFKARVPGREGTAYLAFLALGMWPWFAFSEAVGRGAGALVDNAGLLSKIAIAPWQLVMARVLAAFALHGAGLVLVVLALQIAAVPLQWQQFPLAMLAWLLLFPLAFAAALVLALVQAFVRDFAQILPHLLTLLLFTSPILYHRDLMPAWLGNLQWLNPLGSLIAAVRDPLLGGAPPPGLLLSALIIVAMLAASAAAYRRLRPAVEDFL